MKVSTPEVYSFLEDRSATLECKCQAIRLAIWISTELGSAGWVERMSMRGRKAQGGILIMWDMTESTMYVTLKDPSWYELIRKPLSSPLVFSSLEKARRIYPILNLDLGFQGSGDMTCPKVERNQHFPINFIPLSHSIVLFPTRGYHTLPISLRFLPINQKTNYPNRCDQKPPAGRRECNKRQLFLPSALTDRSNPLFIFFILS